MQRHVYYARVLALALLSVISLFAQGGKSVYNPSTGKQDYIGDVAVTGMKTGTILPSTCSVGQIFFKSNAVAGQNAYGCTSTNTWTVLGAAVTIPINGAGMVCAADCVAGETTNWKWTAPYPLLITGCLVDAVTYPTGSNLTIDVIKNGTLTNSGGIVTVASGSSVFASTLLTLPDGGTTFAEQAGMSAAAAMVKGDYLTWKLVTAGSTVHGQFVNAVCYGNKI